MDFVVTKEMIENATDYLPLRQKTLIARNQAITCVRKTEETTGIRTNDGNILPLPPRYAPDDEVRAILEMSIFTALYLKCEPVQENGDVTMDGDTYDYYAGSHIFGQLNHMKGELGRTDPELKTKIVNMLADFNDYQKRLTSAIRAQMTLYNDPVDRFMAMNAAMTTPEGMQGLLADLKDAAEALEEYKEERAGEAE